MTRKLRNKILGDSLIWVIIAAFVVIMLFPFVYILSTALKSDTDLATSVGRILPKAAQWENFTKAWQLLDFPKCFFNSFIVAIAVTALTIFLCSLAAYEDKITTFGHLLKAMKEDFRDDEILRQYLLHKVPKFCKDKDATEFGKKVMDDLAECLGGQANYRGGKFEPSLFAFYSYNWFKNVTIATADGRKSESALSRGVNPSESTENINIAALLDAIKTMDYTKYPGGAVIYMDIPLMYKTPQPSLFASVMRAFCENGGSIMDFNVISRNALLEAQKNPETHKNIVVRVCGYSAYFHTLTAEMQNEVIQRTQR